MVYELPIPRAFWRSGANLEPPQLRVAHEAGSWNDVPMADLRWEVWLPRGSRLVASGGTVMREEGLGLFDRIQGWLERLHRWGGRLELQREVKLALEMSQSPSFTAGTDQPMPMAQALSEEKAVVPQAAMPQDFDALAENMPSNQANKGMEMARDKSKVQEEVGATTKGKDAKESVNRWSLEGVRSLPIGMEQESEVDSWKFSNLGGAPRLQLAWIDPARSDWLGWLGCLLTLMIGVRIAVVHRNYFIRFLVVSWVGALVLPECTPWVLELEPVS